MYNLEEENNRLKSELIAARTAILEFAKTEYLTVLESYMNCETREQTLSWRFNVVETILAKHCVNTDGHDASVCPLCGEQVSSTWGLKAHLLGAGRGHVCSVTQAAFQLAKDYWDVLFQSPLRPTFQQRMLSEDVYVVTPNGEPQLLDCGLVSSFCRSQSEVRWAEARIKTFGLVNKLSERVKMFVRDYQEFVIYGDPRRANRIDFRVFGKYVDSMSGSQPMLGQFNVSDALKTNLTQAFDAHVKAIVGDKMYARATKTMAQPKGKVIDNVVWGVKTNNA